MGAVWVTLPGQVSHGQWDAVTHRPEPGLARAAGTGQHREHWAKWGTAGVAGCMEGRCLVLCAGCSEQGCSE